MTKKKLFIAAGTLLIVALLLIALFTGEISLTPERDVYPVGTTEVTARFKNALPGRYEVGQKYTLEKYTAGSWEPVTRDEKGAFFDDSGFSPSFRSKMTFDITKYCDSLTEGEYRITVTATDCRSGDKDISFDFEVRG